MLLYSDECGELALFFINNYIILEKLRKICYYYK